MVIDTVVNSQPLRAGGTAARAQYPTSGSPTIAADEASSAGGAFGVLSVCATGEDQAALNNCLGGVSVRITAASTCREALARLKYGGISVVICDADLPDGTWRDILDYLQTAGERPELIVASRLADDYLWSEVLNLGGFDVLAKPFRAVEVRHVVETACRQRGRSARRFLAATA